MSAAVLLLLPAAATLLPLCAAVLLAFFGCGSLGVAAEATPPPLPALPTVASCWIRLAIGAVMEVVDVRLDLLWGRGGMRPPCSPRQLANEAQQEWAPVFPPLHLLTPPVC